MGRRYYKRNYYRKRSYSKKSSGNNGSDLKILLYVIFLPVILLFLLIKLIIILIKKINVNRINISSQNNIYLKTTNEIPSYRLDSCEIKQDDVQQTTYQQKESLVTEYEKYFYTILEENFGDIYKIQTQVNLASIIKKVDNSKYQNELFRNLDFGIFEKFSLKPLLMIEINDSTHKNVNRYQRDLNVRKILEESNIKLITFYSGYENKKDYVVNRIKNELNK